MNTTPTKQPSTKQPSTEQPGTAMNGVLVLFLLVLGIVAIAMTIASLIDTPNEPVAVALLFGGIISTIVVLVGFFLVQPNTSCVLVFLGKYRGTVRTEGFFWASPLTVKRKITLRAYNRASDTIKVNDLNGNPIEIGAVAVWRVKDTAKACFDVDDYDEYVSVQIETAVRELAKTHPYESHSQDGQTSEDGRVVSLRSDTDAISRELTAELQQRLERAGIEVLEARISHLAYALEIASAMLQRQQAAAIISARRLIVEGAVGMVEHALGDLQARGVVDLDDERKATMVSNLLVVLCSHAEPTPVINAGGLYN